jgi:uncharacterized protein YqkB
MKVERLMKLTITSLALTKINELKRHEDKYLLLRYDTKGLGCGVNGMPTFCLVSQKDEQFIEVENNAIPTIINEMQSIFFAESMKLDYSNGTFRLSSPEGILNPFIPTNSILS